MAERKERSAREAFNRILWDPRLDAETFVVGYLNREGASAGVREKPLRRFEAEGEIPSHRVVYVRCGAHVFWHRDPEKVSTGPMPAEALAQAPAALLEPRASLRIVTFNVLADAAGRAGVVEALRRCEADVLALQEVTARFLEEVKGALPGWHAAAAPLHPHGVVLLARWPITVSVKTLTEHKSAVVATFPRAGGTVHVCTLHLHSDRAENAREQRRTHLASVLAWLGAMGGDAVVAGDLNARGDELDDLFELHGFSDAWRIGRGDAPGCTYDPSVNPRAAEGTLRGERARFDRVLLRGEVHVRGVEVREARHTDGAWLSDHAMVVADLGWGSAADPVPRIEATDAPVHRSALCIIPPKAAWDPIQSIRRKHDRQFRRWMPHINLLYGFVPDDRFEAVLSAVRRAVDDLTPFEVELADYDVFEHRNDCTVWLRATPPGMQAMRTLQALLRAAFPACDEQESRGPFTPHLSIGRFPSLEGALDVLPEWMPLRFLVDQMCLISRRGDGPFEVRHRVALPGKRRREAEMGQVREACRAVLPDAELHRIGSTRLGVEGPDSDLDLLCISSAGMPRAEFFTRLARRLRGEVVQIAEHARVPVLRTRGGIELQYAVRRGGGWDDEASVLAALALDEADALERFVRETPGMESFRALMREVRAFTDARRIRGAAWGYPGSHAWMLMAAWSRAGSLADMVTRLADHDWRVPVALSPNDYAPRSRDRLPVITAAPPWRNAAATVTASTASIIVGEIRRAAAGDDPFEPAVSTSALPLRVRALDIEARGRVESRLVGFILELERAGARVRPWPGFEGDETIVDVGGMAAEAVEAAARQCFEMVGASVRIGQRPPTGAPSRGGSSLGSAGGGRTRAEDEAP